MLTYIISKDLFVYGQPLRYLLKPSLHIYHDDFRVLQLLVIQEEESEESADAEVTNESNKDCPDAGNEIENGETDGHDQKSDDDDDDDDDDVINS